MAAKNRPYEQFGRYILFKKLESAAFSELWRAGRIDGTTVGATVALRRFPGAARDTVNQIVPYAKQIMPLLSGTSFVRDQQVDSEGGVPFLVHDYSGGRSLRHIVDRSRGDTGATPNPIPLDQAIVIAEKVAFSLATTEEFRIKDKRLTHGALLPHFIWITDEGEIRVAGQQLAKGIVAALHDPAIAAEIGRYVAPEQQTSAESTRSSEVYALGAVLYLLVTGQEPPDPLSASAFGNAINAAKTTVGEPLPDDIRAVLDRSLTLDAKRRYATAAEMKTAISALANSGNYSATTFNLAFYLSSLLRKEFEGEAIDRDREGKLNLAPYLEPVSATEPRPAPAAAPARSASPAAPLIPSAPLLSSPLSAPAEGKSKAPLAIGAIVLLAAIGGGAWMMMGPSKKAESSKQIAAAAVTPAEQPRVVSQPIVVSAPDGTTTAPLATAGTASTDTAATQKEAFEKAVELRLQQEMMKLQSDYNKKLQREGSDLAPVNARPANVPAPQVERSPAPVPQPETARREETSQPVPAPVTQQPAPPVVQQQAPAAAPAVAQVREGDVVDVNSVDSLPQLTRAIRPDYPPAAVRQRMEGTVILTALVSETGSVLDVRVLGGERRLGLDEAAMRALRSAKFSPAMKDGKKVKTWLPIPVKFKL